MDTTPPGSRTRQRLRVSVRGAVQGVGFRPFVYRLARELSLDGWVYNDAAGVLVEAEGDGVALREFLVRLSTEKPALAVLQGVEPTFLAPVGLAGFEIRESPAGGLRRALVLPDVATCPACLAELWDPADRRHRYPFLNCTHCGPRFSILESLPYDRARTTMARFPMCPACRAEYEEPSDRRFHAQPTACPDCGPTLALWDGAGRFLCEGDAALRRAAGALKAGGSVALKGLGGFQLLVDARSEAAVRRLRAAKHREEKPLALMVADLAVAGMLCEISPLEARLLASSEAPIVLLDRRPRDGVAPGVAPGNPCLGVMLPYTPLHHLLMREIAFPVVATSGNASDEPICTDEREALTRLGGMADLFLVHDRPIARPVDDSVARVVGGRELLLRRARGYAPLPVTVPVELPPLLCLGAHLKNTVAVTVGRDVFLSQHLGDLETAPALEAFRHASHDLASLYEVSPVAVACDLHPDYASTREAETAGLPVVRVQHHYAHALACLAENETRPPALGVTWDGTGYGTDGTVWGGEFLRVEADGFTRFAHLRTFPLPGGDKAAREPRRVALGLLWERFGEAALGRTDLAPLAAFSSAELPPLAGMLRRSLNCPRTSSVGRLFDAVASLCGLCQNARYEGQAAMALEFVSDSKRPAPYPLPLTQDSPGLLDWEPMLDALLADLAEGAPARTVSARFHAALAEAAVAVARRAGLRTVALSGGCFQNRRLVTWTTDALEAAGFRPLTHQRVPPNDGGVALGQALAAAAARPKEE